MNVNFDPRTGVNISRGYSEHVEVFQLLNKANFPITCELRHVSMCSGLPITCHERLIVSIQCPMTVIGLCFIPCSYTPNPRASFASNDSRRPRFPCGFGYHIFVVLGGHACIVDMLCPHNPPQLRRGMNSRTSGRNGCMGEY